LVKETTTTTGTGNVTLSAVTDFSRFTEYFNTDEIVSYIIEDANGDREEGMGTIVTGNVLARTLPKITRVSGTLDKSAPTALTLSTGTHNVYIDSPVGAQPPIDTWLYSASIKDVPDNVSFEVTRTTAWTADQLSFYPAHFARGRFITNIGVNVVTPDATETIGKLGIYTCLPDGSIGTLITSVTIDATTTGVKSVALVTATYFPPGWYYFGYASDASPEITTTSTTGINYAPFGVTASLARFYKPYQTLTGGWSALPASFSITGFNDNYPPLVYFS